MSHKNFYSLGAVILLGFLPDLCGQAVILSEGWESPSRGGHGNGEIIAGWVVSGSIDIVGNTHGMLGPSHSDAQGIELNGGNPGAVSTNLSLAPGSFYMFTFAYTKNPEIGSARGAVKLDGATIATITADQPNTPTSLNWQLGSVRFRATSSTHEFKLEGLESGNAGLYVDTMEIRRDGNSFDAYVNSNHVDEAEVFVRGRAELALSAPYAGAIVLYTLDGSDPSANGSLYTEALTLKKSAQVKAIAYNQDFSQSTELEPFQLFILPELLISTDGGGTVSMDPASGQYFTNSGAVIMATPDPGWAFIGWMGDVVSDQPVVAVSVSNTLTATAVFGTTLSNSVIGSGSVTISPSTALYPFGAKVQAIAIPQNSYFVQWGGDATGTNNPLILIMTNEQASVTALFAALPAGSYSLAVLPVGPGKVQVSPYANRYAAGTNVTVTAISDANQTFIGWGGDASGTNNPLTVSMTKSKVIQANFSMRPLLRLRSAHGDHPRSNLPISIEVPLSSVIDFEQSSNLFGWTALARLTNATGRIELPPYPAPNALQQFYRARLIAP